MRLAEQALSGLFPEKNINLLNFKLKYSDKFKPYNANVRYRPNSFEFGLSKKWKGVSNDIQIGLIQGLMLKIYKKKATTLNIDLYNNFMKNIYIAAPKVNIDPLLEKSFNRVNDNYFLGMIELPNLVWHNSTRRFGSYEYGSDTISMSKILLGDTPALDYVMYHEMLHKKFKFSSTNGRACHHSKEFREMERKFESSQEMEKRLMIIARRSRRKIFGLF
jgi:hypothetical protein